MTKIEIKPNDQSCVGKKIGRENFQPEQFWEILFVGNKKVFLRGEDGEEIILHIGVFLNGYSEWDPPKQKVMRAQAIIYSYMCRPYVTVDFFTKEEIGIIFSKEKILEFPYGPWKEFNN